MQTRSTSLSTGANVLLIHNAHDLPTKIVHVGSKDVEQLNRQILEFAFARSTATRRTSHKAAAGCSRLPIGRSARSAAD